VLELVASLWHIRAERIASSKAKRLVSYYLLFYMFLLICLGFRQKSGSHIVLSVCSSVAIIELLIWRGGVVLGG
jgi:hypothetical protein